MSHIDGPSDLDYTLNLSQMQTALDAAIAASRAYSGIRARPGRRTQGAMLFTSLTTRAFTLLRIVPATVAERREGHWDFATVAACARAILEVRLTFFYLTEACTEDEWCTRVDILSIHDCTSRMKLFRAMGEHDGTGQLEEIAQFGKQLAEVQDRLQRRPFFAALPSGNRKQHLNGSKAHLHALEDIGARCGIAVPVFRMFYLIWSTQAHGLPMSYYRMSNGERGAGVHSHVEESYTAMCLNLCAQLLVDSTAEMHELFRDLPGEQNLRPSVPGLLGKMMARIGQ